MFDLHEPLLNCPVFLRTPQPLALFYTPDALVFDSLEVEPVTLQPVRFLHPAQPLYFQPPILEGPVFLRAPQPVAFFHAPDALVLDSLAVEAVTLQPVRLLHPAQPLYLQPPVLEGPVFLDAPNPAVFFHAPDAVLL